MKLLLTSGGITNKSIANVLFSLTEKKPEDTTVVFIPTASNLATGDKDWLINDLINLKKLNFKSAQTLGSHCNHSAKLPLAASSLALAWPYRSWPLTVIQKTIRHLH